LSIKAIVAEDTPFPIPEITPPEINMNFDMFSFLRLLINLTETGGSVKDMN
jgi:hypothetical protein